ncbi:MAG: zinc ABC transporter solute-binding protein [Gammaproteobacteria bacterium]|nr:zinc ABC transporter solute-binding protein [Gammaproteobacteria bacterium]
MKNLFLLVLIVLNGAGNAIAAEAAPFSVFVSLLPQKYFVERVGGDRVRVFVMVGSGQSPATYEPVPGQLLQLNDARLYFRIGVPFETVWMERIAAANPNMHIVDCRDGIDLHTVRHARKSPSESAPSSTGERDPHIWTSPPLVKIMALRIKNALIESDPTHQAEYTANYRQFADDLEHLDKNIRTMLAGVRKRRFMVFHPTWGYFADTYGLEQISIEHEGKTPGAKTLARLIDLAEQEGTRVIFVQKQFSRRSAKTVARAIQGEIAILDPLAENYLENMRHAAAMFSKAMR